MRAALMLPQSPARGLHPVALQLAQHQHAFPVRVLAQVPARVPRPRLRPGPSARARGRCARRNGTTKRCRERGATEAPAAERFRTLYPAGAVGLG